MRRLLIMLLLGGVALLGAAATLLIPDVRSSARALLRPEPPAQITPLALSLPPTATPTSAPTATATPAPTGVAATQSTATATIAPTATLPPTPTRGPVTVNGQVFDVYIPTANKPGQFFQYSCEFDAAWAILTTYGIPTTGEDLVSNIDHDKSIEPHMDGKTADGVTIVRGGDIEHAYSGDYTHNFLARSTGTAFQKVFERYGLRSELVNTRETLQAALDRGELVWMKTTVDFKPWRPALWIMPDGRTHQTVLGNDHAVVVMGYSERGVVIRDVLGPTSTNRQRPYEYEVAWDKFMASWGAQSFDALAVVPPTP